MQQQLGPLAAYIRRNAMANRAVERIGPFVATFTDRSDNPFLNYAIPDDGAIPSDQEVGALVAACRRRGRTPRLEYFPALAPDVAPRLRAAGFAVEGRLALMTCTPAQLRAVPAPVGITVGIAAGDEEFLAAAGAQHEAYGEPEPAGRSDAARLRELAERGGLVGLAAETATGAAAGAVVCDVIRDGVGELAGA
jgi:hypothetical protein